MPQQTPHTPQEWLQIILASTCSLISFYLGSVLSYAYRGQCTHQEAQTLVSVKFAWPFLKLHLIPAVLCLDRIIQIKPKTASLIDGTLLAITSEQSLVPTLRIIGYKDSSCVLIPRGQTLWEGTERGSWMQPTRTVQSCCVSKHGLTRPCSWQAAQGTQRTGDKHSLNYWIWGWSLT